MKLAIKKQLKQITVCCIATSVGLTYVSLGSWNSACSILCWTTLRC